MTKRPTRRGRDLRYVLAATLLGLCALLTACCGHHHYQGVLAPGPQPNRPPVLMSAVQADRHPS